MTQARRAQDARKQQGATAIEFSIVFALLFAVFWAIISYALPFFMYQTMNHAVAEAARQIVRFENPTDAQARTELETQLNRFLPETFVGRLNIEQTAILPASLTGLNSDGTPTTDAGGNPTGLDYQVLTIRVTYPGCNTSNLRSSCITPALNLIGASIPNLGPYTTETRIRLARN